MIPYDWNEEYVLWHSTWRNHIARAKEEPTTEEGYCRAAMIAQMEYVTHLALYLNKEKSNGSQTR